MKMFLCSFLQSSAPAPLFRQQHFSQYPILKYLLLWTALSMREQFAHERKLSGIFTFMSILILILLSETKQNILQQAVYDILYI
jgi:hypothetical protein